MSFLNFEYSMLIRLVAAAVLGGLIGLERGGSKHEAGLRTHIILCLGSATAMVVGEAMALKYGGDAMRIGAQVVSGIGFLGAGSIIVHGSRVKGITTAAGLWTTACVGLAVGSGLYIVAAVVVALMLFAMWALRPLTSRLQSKSTLYSLKVGLTDKSALKDIFHMLMNANVRIQSVIFEGHGDSVFAVLEIMPQKSTDIDKLTCDLVILEGVIEISVI